MKVWKYPFNLTDSFTLAMPAGAEILSCQRQRGELHLWCLVDPSAQLEERHFAIVPNDCDLGELDHLGYIETFQIADGNFVFHLFEV